MCDKANILIDINLCNIPDHIAKAQLSGLSSPFLPDRLYLPEETNQELLQVVIFVECFIKIINTHLTLASYCFRNKFGLRPLVSFFLPLSLSNILSISIFIYLFINTHGSID